MSVGLVLRNPSLADLGLSFCMVGATEYSVHTTVTATQDIPPTFTGCHSHGTETYVDSDCIFLLIHTDLLSASVNPPVEMKWKSLWQVKRKSTTRSPRAKGTAISTPASSESS